MSYEHCEIHDCDATNGCEKCEQRKPYSRPKLTRYGTLEQITEAVGNMGMFDNAGGKSRSG